MKENETRKQIWFRAARQAGTIVLLAVIPAILINQIRPDRLLLMADWSPETQLTFESGESMVISLEEARDNFLSGKAIFLDARAPEFYKEGHIKDARNLPWESMEEYLDPIMADISQGTLIIIYCDGESCTLSKDLAQELFFRGYENIRVLIDGWSLWKKHRLPIG